VDGIHDVGGMQGFGAVEPTPHEPPFHEPWEGRAHGVMLASAIAVPTGSLRPYIEQMGHIAYLTSSYYERWLTALEARLVAAGTVSIAELRQRQAALAAGQADVPVRHDPGTAAFVRSLFRPFDIADRDWPPPHYRAGDPVRVRRMHPTGHTRCPRYVRGAPGTVALMHAAAPLPDRLPGRPGREIVPEPYYTVAFSPEDLWGEDAEPGAATVHVDLWESYLEEREAER
jgi:nitrile hydratase beta subunit